MRIVFMGTPEFAVPSLEILHDAGYEIAAVITSPDKKGGRGRNKVLESAVKIAALERGLKIMQPTNLKSESFQEKLKELNADLQIVVAFRMLPEKVWNMPPLGTYNLHGSLLPKYRGAAPINWAVIHGETKTGVTSFKLKHKIDTGSILLQKEIPVLYEDNATMLHDRMMPVAAELALESVKLIESGNYHLKEQDNSQVSHAPKLTKENTEIDFNKPVETVYNFIRGLSFYPAAWFNLGDASVKVFSSDVTIKDHSFLPGKIVSDNKSYIYIYCQDGYLSLKEIKYPGKRKMLAKEFLNGFDLSPFY